MVKKRIALVAHDAKKHDLMDWVKFNKGKLQPHKMWATGTTGGLLKQFIGDLDITTLLSGPLGGDQQLGSMIAEGKLDILIFFPDPLAAQPHDVDVKALTRLAEVYNLPMALNRSTADFIISSPLFASDYEPAHSDYSSYVKRKV